MRDIIIIIAFIAVGSVLVTTMLRTLYPQRTLVQGSSQTSSHHPLSHVVSLANIGDLLTIHHNHHYIQIDKIGYNIGEQVYELRFTQGSDNTVHNITFTESEFQHVKREIEKMSAK